MSLTTYEICECNNIPHLCDIWSNFSCLTSSYYKEKHFIVEVFMKVLSIIRSSCNTHLNTLGALHKYV
jgi:hypothetical protein